MPEIKLPRLPDRIPVKLTIAVSPELSRALTEYAAVYAEVYGREEPIGDLIPAMLTNFLDTDREFTKRRKALQSN